MENIQKYSSFIDYTNRTEDTVIDECCVSQIGQSADMSVIYDIPRNRPTNRVLEYWQLGKYDVAAVVIDNMDGRTKYIMDRQLDVSSLDTSRYILDNKWIRYYGNASKQFLVHTENATIKRSNSFCAPNYYKFFCNTRISGSCEIKIDGLGDCGTVRGTFSWSASGSMADIANSLTLVSYTGVEPSISKNKNDENDNSHNIVVYAQDGENFVRMVLKGHGEKHMTVITSSQTEYVEDLSRNLLYDYGGLQPEVPEDYTPAHNSWQNNPFENIPDSLKDEVYIGYGASGFQMVNQDSSTCIHGEDTGSHAGVNLRSMISNFYSDGSQDWHNAFTDTDPVSEDCFSNSDLNLEFDGNYQAYMVARMVDLDSNLGVFSVGGDRLNEITDVLSRFKTKYFDGSVVPVFSAAETVKSIDARNIGGTCGSIMTAKHAALVFNDCIGATLSSGMDAGMDGTKYRIDQLLDSLGHYPINADYNYYTCQFYGNPANSDPGRYMWFVNGREGLLKYRDTGLWEPSSVTTPTSLRPVCVVRAS